MNKVARIAWPYKNYASFIVILWDTWMHFKCITQVKCAFCVMRVATMLFTNDPNTHTVCVGSVKIHKSFRKSFISHASMRLPAASTMIINSSHIPISEYAPHNCKYKTKAILFSFVRLRFFTSSPNKTQNNNVLRNIWLGETVEKVFRLNWIEWMCVLWKDEGDPYIINK